MWWWLLQLKRHRHKNFCTAVGHSGRLWIVQKGMLVGPHTSHWIYGLPMHQTSASLNSNQWWLTGVGGWAFVIPSHKIFIPRARQADVVHDLLIFKNIYLILDTCWWWACSLRFRMPISDQCLSSLFLKLFTDGASITCCGRAFQWLTTLILKNIFRTVVEHLDKNNFRLCPRRLCESVAKRHVPSQSEF